jgi:hypothetical protein
VPDARRRARIIARRIPYVSFAVLARCGVIMHQVYTQLLPLTAADVAAQAKRKDLLGYHDIRVGSDPDGRLLKFIDEDLPRIAPAARQRFEEYKDLLSSYVHRQMSYDEFVGRASRRDRGVDEDFDR